MFIQLTTKKGEKYTLNLNHIVSFFDVKGGCVIIDINGIDYQAVETYDFVMDTIKNLKI